jgi:hypothetical protein
MHDNVDPEERLPKLSEEDLAESNAGSGSEVNLDQFRPVGSASVDFRYSGVRGWLMFFIITLVLLSPLGTCSALGQYDQAWKPFYTTYPLLRTIGLINLVVGFGLVCFSVYAGIKLWRIRPNAVHIAKTYLLVLAISSIVLTCLPLFAGLPERANTAILEALPVDVIKLLVYPTLWYFYLNNSKRVATTYSLVG